ncbi:hydrolase [Armatimonas rosea]|uniref:Hydroxymethylpyrimidine pyrophosphatase-like HAD family hydrolase n=1 Tax=Armatimonas rosea TaxID=685828 RepID=A0A7W9W597_ARMRO|nr:hydrolase [Armatimonas rosea]MBB6049368.1 hydroxymethylpyrimidine pyrophosphatase-like HAD family hydrolase [Armatimonas rosea]
MARVAFVDVDDTLVRSVGTKRIPMVRTIEHVRTLKNDGWGLYCWSAGGGEYARQSAEELGIADCFVGFLPKPNLMIDDLRPDEWRGFSILHPSNLQNS